MSRFNRREFITRGAALTLAAPVVSLPSVLPGTAVPTNRKAHEEIFTDRAHEAGIDFVYFNGMSGAHYYPEIVGGGAALFDYDNDGDLDIFIPQGHMLGPGKTLTNAVFRPCASCLPLKGRLFRNDSSVNPDGTHTLKFTDVTEESGINASGYGMGVAAGDFNNDGWVDLYITNFGHNQMWRNNGDGTFTDVTRETGTDVPGWSVSAAFIDFDRDGWLDLFVGQYVNFSFYDLKKCVTLGAAEDYCGPTAYDPLPNRLFRNRGDGTFEDVTARSQIGREYNGALGVVTADFNGDGWPDIYVADDERPNQLWMNRQNGTFSNDALLAGCGLDNNGVALSGMGVDAGDFNNDGYVDILVANLTGEHATLYVNDGHGWFVDRSAESGVGTATMAYTGWGAGFLDYDNDGWLDILVVNGEVRTIEAQARAGVLYPLRQPKVLLHNLGNGLFENVSRRAGPVFGLAEVSRGVAFGDVDNDGDMDALIVNNNGPARLMINNVGHEKHWLGLRMIGGEFKRDMLGTRVAVYRARGPTLWRHVHTDGSYASANDPRVLFGLGHSPEIAKIRAYWIDGRVEEWTDVRVDRYTTLHEGTGVPVKPK